MRIVIAEDLALLRDGLTRLLRDSGFEVVAAVEDGDALVAAVERERPDIAIVDVRLPPTFTVTSPPGGPTTVRAEIPCAP